MKNILKGTFFLLIIFLVTCGTNDKQKVDNFLGDYEKVVVKWESQIADGEFTDIDSDEMNKIISDMEANAKELQKVTKWTTAQQEKYAKLTERIMDAIFKTIKIPEGFSF